MTQPYPDDSAEWNPVDLPEHLVVPDGWKDQKVTVSFDISIRDALDYDNRNIVFEKFWEAYKNAVLVQAHQNGLRSRAD
jgi:hypothetical protein